MRRCDSSDPTPATNMSFPEGSLHEENTATSFRQATECLPLLDHDGNGTLQLDSCESPDKTLGSMYMYDDATTLFQVELHAKQLSLGAPRVAPDEPHLQLAHPNLAWQEQARRAFRSTSMFGYDYLVAEALAFRQHVATGHNLSSTVWICRMSGSGN